jgi:hypothetical protein
MGELVGKTKSQGAMGRFGQHHGLGQIFKTARTQDSITGSGVYLSCDRSLQ